MFVTGVAAIATLLLFFLRRELEPRPVFINVQPTESEAGLALAPATPVTVARRSFVTPIPQPPVQSPSQNSPDDKSGTENSTDFPDVAKRAAELQSLAMNSDRDSLDLILAELNNQDPQIRKAAVDAAIQFGSRDSVAALTDALAQTDDPSEKVDLLKAIEYLNLPSLTQAGE